RISRRYTDSVVAVRSCPARRAMLSTGTPFADRTETKVCLISRVPSPRRGLPRHAVRRRHRRNGKNFDAIEQELRTQAAGQLRASGAAWEFERRQSIVVDELIAAATAIGEAHPDVTLAIIVGSSSPGNHRVVGSVA